MTSVLITGCSSGFGLITTVTLAKRGFKVFASMRNLEKAGRLRDALSRAGTLDNVEIIPLDVTDRSSIDSALKHIHESKFGELWGVVHNAGIAVGGPFEEIPEDSWRSIFETNVFGVFALTQAVLPAMRERRRGRIVVIGSEAGLAGAPATSVYCASKHALEGWAESLAYEIEPFGMRIVMIEPGSYKTEIWDTSDRIAGESSPYAEMNRILEEYVEGSVRRKARDPQEVADAIVKALTLPEPRLRYPIGPDAKAIRATRGLVPDRLKMIGLRKLAGLDKWNP